MPMYIVRLLEWPEQKGVGRVTDGVEWILELVAYYAVSCRIGSYISAYFAYVHIFSKSA